eukprot:GCRY01001512.1.p1 GENE.GCRY01001512.1~~GCRY01001512.1.p1  ORF type:complete len:180 (+),score=20.28 GCRY01001512.1:74-613(+)
MRPLTESETRVFFEKLAKFIGSNIRFLIDRPENPHCFRLQKDRVYYVSEAVMKKATNVGRKQLSSLGTCFGKFTQSGKFNLQITCLDYLAQYCQYKVWVKPQAEQTFLYGNNILRAGLARITEDTPQYQGVIVYTNEIPIGFGVTVKSTQEIRRMEPAGVVVIHQGDVGEYLRLEETMF